MGEWREVPLSQVVTLQRGHDLPTNLRRLGAVPVIGSFGITGRHDVAKYRGPGVAIGRSGASIGVATWCPEDYWPLNTCLFVKDFHGNDPRWVYLLLDSIDFSGFNSGSAQPSLNRNYLAGVPVLVPPIAEQRAIAKVIGALEDKIEANRNTAHRSEQLAQAIVKTADPSIPLGRIAELRHRTVLPAAFAKENVDHFSLPAYDENRLPARVLGESIKSGKLLLEDPMVLVAKLNPHIPRVWLASPAEGIRSVASTEFIPLVPSIDFEIELLWGMCSDQRVCNQLAEMARGTTGSHQRVAPDDLFKIHVPSPGEVAKPARSVIRYSVRLADALRRESAPLSALRDVLLPKLLSGEMRVQEAATAMGAV